MELSPNLNPRSFALYVETGSQSSTWKIQDLENFLHTPVPRKNEEQIKKPPQMDRLD